MKVADFGLLKEIHDRTCSAMGGMTPVYAAPELFDGRPSAASDQYSLAIVYQEMLTGALPFESETLRQAGLDEARRLAREAGHRGAMYPWQSGSDGREESQVLHLNPRSGRWIPDHTFLQRHVNAAIAHNVWQYFQVTRDLEFLSFFGAEMFLEIARFWASFATWNERLGRYEILGVVGPDEFHTADPDSGRPGLDNHAYTNVMAAWVLSQAPLPPRFSIVLAAAAVIAVPTGLILLQPDFGTAMLVAASGVFALYLAGLSWGWFIAAGVGAASAAGLALVLVAGACDAEMQDAIWARKLGVAFSFAMPDSWDAANRELLALGVAAAAGLAIAWLPTVALADPTSARPT